MIAARALLLVMLLLTGCGDPLLSKEQQQVSDAIKRAIEADPALLNAPHADGEPPLHIALTNHLPELFDWLMARGADPGARDRRGQTTMHKAVIFDAPDNAMMRALLKRGADINVRDNDGGTPLHLAAFLSRAARIEALLAAGADANARDNRGARPLHEAASPQPTASPADAARSIDLLIARGAEADARTRSGGTALHRAALMGSTLAVRRLLAHGALADLSDAAGQTPLHVAATFAKSEVAQILLDAGAQPNPRDRAGLTPLARALRYPAVSGNGPVDTREVVEILQRFGAIDPDATAKTAGGKQPDGEREAVYSAALPIRQRADNPWLWKGVQNALLYAGVRHEVAEIRPLIEGALLTVEVRFKGCAPPHDRTRVINDANSWTIAKGSPVRCGEPADKAFEPSAPD